MKVLYMIFFHLATKQQKSTKKSVIIYVKFTVYYGNICKFYKYEQCIYNYSTKNIVYNFKKEYNFLNYIKGDFYGNQN